MIAQTVSDLPKGLIKLIHDLDLSTKGHPVLPDDKIEVALGWLRRIVLDFDALDAHIALLQDLYDSPFRYPRMRRDQLPGYQQAAAEPTRFAYQDPLEEGRVSAILEGGSDVLRPDERNRHELPKLLLNPVALHDLFDVINDVLPEQWLSEMQAVGKEMWQREGATSTVAPQLLPGPLTNPLAAADEHNRGRQDARKAMMWLGAIAAGLLLVLGSMTWVMVSQHNNIRRLTAEIDRVRGEHNPSSSKGESGLDWHLVASIKPSQMPRAAKEGKSLFIESDESGFAAFVLLRPNNLPEVLPPIGGNPLAVGAAKETPVEWPLEENDVVANGALLLVVTRQPAAGFLHEQLALGKYQPDRLDAIRAEIESLLTKHGYVAPAVRVIPMPK
jgi:hypothetical protein